MTPDEAYRLAKYQLPGVSIVVGPEFARLEEIKPLSDMALFRLPGDASFLDRDMRIRFGFLPSLVAKWYIFLAELMGHDVTTSEAKWLHGPASKQEMQNWISHIFAERVGYTRTT